MQLTLMKIVVHLLIRRCEGTAEEGSQEHINRVEIPIHGATRLYKNFRRGWKVAGFDLACPQEPGLFIALECDDLIVPLIDTMSFLPMERSVPRMLTGGVALKAPLVVGRVLRAPGLRRPSPAEGRKQAEGPN